MEYFEFCNTIVLHTPRWSLNLHQKESSAKIKTNDNLKIQGSGCTGSESQPFLTKLYQFLTMLMLVILIELLALNRFHFG